jgi:hypothetical protein
LGKIWHHQWAAEEEAAVCRMARATSTEDGGSFAEDNAAVVDKVEAEYKTAEDKLAEGMD